MGRRGSGTVLTQGLMACLCCVALLIAGSAPGRAQQATSEWQSGPPVERQAPGRGTGNGGAAAKGATGAPVNTTVVPRTAEPKSNPNIGEVSLAAFLTDDGQRIDQGLVWRLFQEQSGSIEVRPKLIGSYRDPAPLLKLAPGGYIVNAAFGRAHLTRKIKVEGGAATQERFVLNAGGLRVSALVGKGVAAPEQSVSYEIFSGDTDQLGNRARIMGGAKPGLIIRLNAGIYHLVSTYGDANAVVKADVTVEAGKLTEATTTHQGARVTFKLVQRAGGEAQADTQWSIATPQGEPVKESVGALPTHILDPGPYVVTAKHGGRTFRRAFTLPGNDATQIEVVME